jgi:PAS domain S-box-containing protein
VRTAFEDRQGDLWFSARGAYGGLFRIRDGNIRRFGQEDGLAHPTVNVIFQDRAGSLWLGTQRGLSRLSNGRLTSYTAKDGLPDDSVLAIHEDQEGGLWIGTGGAGLARLREGSFTTYTNKEGLSLNALRTVCVSSDGAVWAGTNGSGLSRFKNGVFTTFNRATGLPMDSVDAIAEDPRGGMWFGSGVSGSERQLVHYRSGRFTQYPVMPVRSLLADDDGVWVGTNGMGLQRFTDGEFKPLTVDDEQRQSARLIWVLHRDRDKRLWAGVHGSLCHTVGDMLECQALPKTEHLNPPVLSIENDSGGGLWLGTWVGLFHYKDGVFTRYGVEAGLPQTRMRTVLEDSRRNLWLCAPSAVLRVQRETLNRWRRKEIPKLDYESYDATHGMKSNQFDHEGVVAGRAPNGRLWFATLGGLVTVDPAAVTKSEWMPPVVIEDILADKQRVDPARLERIPPGRGEIEVHYAGLSYHVPERVRFQYMLDGLNDSWVDAGNRRVAYFTRVPHGTYTFRVKASNSDGVWSENGKEARFTILPYWYQTPWFHGFVFLAACGLAYAGYYWRMAAHRTRERTLAHKVEERTSDLQKEIAEHRLTEEKLQEQITERARAEQEARGLAEKLAASNAEMLEQQQALERENQERRRAEEAARTSAEKLSEANADLTEKQRALERENEERRKAEEAAGRERDLLHTLMDNIPDLIYFKDVDGRYTRINRAHAEALGLSDPAQATGHSDADFYTPEYAQAAREDERRLFTTGQPLLGKLEHETRAGRWYLATKVPISDGAGVVSGLVGISKDITERRKAEEQLSRDLDAFLSFVSEVAGGDLTRRGSGSQDTIGKINHAVNHMLEGFVKILSNVREVAFAVSSSSAQILATSTQIAKGAQFGRDQVHSTSSAMSEIVASMSNVSKNAEQSAQAANKVIEHLMASDRAVDASGQGMTRIDTAVSETAENMRKLSARSQEIFEIIDLIEEIASRSELLSMNAAIEAAHAGDAGKGFGVVADEIRHLAERSTEATRSVTTIVKGMATETQAVLAAMETSMREVKSGLELSEQARHDLGEISALVQQAADLAEQISNAVHEQASASQTVANAMETIANFTEQSTAGSNETAKAVQELVQLSERLTQEVSRFRIDAPEEYIARSLNGADKASAMAELARQLDRLVTHLESADGKKANEGPSTTDHSSDLRALALNVGSMLERIGHS